MSLSGEKNSEDAAIRSQIAARVDALRNKDVEALLACYAQDLATLPVAPPAHTDPEAVRKRLYELVRIVRDNPLTTIVQT